MSDKLQGAREYILRKIEDGSLPGGTKLPAAREYAGKCGVSLAIMQMAFTSLTSDGILHSVPRQGTYVREDWRNRILPGSFQTFRPVWKEVLGDLIARDLPNVRVCDKFKKGMYEIVTTWTAQFRQEEYLDLAGFLEEVYPDRSDFFMSQFHSACSREGRLYGIPLIFSPWVIACNVDMIRAAGAEVPQPGWLWEDFLTLVRRLRKIYSADQTLSLLPLSSLWVNLLFRSGGAIIVRENGKYEVRLDDPRTLNGFRRIFELQQLLGSHRVIGANPALRHRETALLLGQDQGCRIGMGDLAVIKGQSPLFAQQLHPQRCAVPAEGHHGQRAAGQNGAGPETVVPEGRAPAVFQQNTGRRRPPVTLGNVPEGGTLQQLRHGDHLIAMLGQQFQLLAQTVGHRRTAGHVVAVFLEDDLTAEVVGIFRQLLGYGLPHGFHFGLVGG